MRAPELDRPSVTYEEYFGWPESNVPCEVVDGAVVVSPAPGLKHQRALMRLAGVLAASIPAGLEVVPSPVDWVLRRDPLLVRQPDLVVIDLHRGVVGPRLAVPPVLAVEVLSPTSRERDLVTKRAQYASAGLDWYWLVDIDVPEVLVLHRRGEVYETAAGARGSDVLRVEEPFSVELRPTSLVP